MKYVLDFNSGTITKELFDFFHVNYNLYIIHVIQSSDCEVFLF